MQTLGQGELNADINVIPLIDVLLVLLIIFMLSMQLRALFAVNVPAPQPAAVHEPSTAIVLDLKADGGYAINGRAVSRRELEARLRAVYQGRVRKVLFVRSAGSRTYAEVVDAIDVAKAAGVDIVGYMP